VPQLDDRSPGNGATANTLTPELGATGHDPDNFPGSGLTYSYSVTSADGKTTIATSGEVGSTWKVPTGELAWNTDYRYTVRASDKVGAGSVSAAYTFTTSNGVSNLATVTARGIGISNDATTSDTTCVTGTTRPAVNTLTPQLWATFTHPTNTTVNADFQYATLDGTVVGTEPVDAVPISGRVQAWIPQDMLHPDTAYQWRVRARDGVNTAPYTGWCEFVVHADVDVDATSTTPDEYTAPTDPTPGSADTVAEDPPGDDPVPGVDDQPPYVPTVDDTNSYDETDVDETDVADQDADQDAVTADGTASALVDDTSHDAHVAAPAFSDSTTCAVTDGVTTSLPDGHYSCPAPQAASAAGQHLSDVPADPTQADAQAFDGSDVDTEADDDGTGEQERVAALTSGTAVGHLGNTTLPTACRVAPPAKWFVGRYDACYNEAKSWIFLTVINGRPRTDGVLHYTVYRYARQDSKSGTWDFHVYLHVDSITGGASVAGARATLANVWCNDGRCNSRAQWTSGSVTKAGAWLQFSGTIQSAVTAGKRITDFANLAFLIARSDDIGIQRVVISSNWVRCDRALKGSTSTGCVVPNYIPTLRYSKHGKYPDLANHIYAAQQSQLPGKPGGILEGQPGSNQALTRLDDAGLRKKNGSRACPSGLRARVGAPSSTTCDEYPFRSTKQGAYTVDPNHNLPRTFSFCHLPRNSHNGPHGYSRCFINGKQNTAGGNWVGRFYSTGSGGQRLLDGDGFYVGIS
jgi:hypothetical protein